jgi:IS4 transposase
MTQRESTLLEESLVRLFPSWWLRARARATGVVRRRRKVDPVAFVWTLILGFGTGKDRTLAGLRRLFVALTGRTVSPSTFYDRFTPELVHFLRELIEHGMEATKSSNGALRGRLAAFKDLLVADATVVRLADLLQKAFPACRTNHTKAAAKLHVVMSVAGAGLRRVRLTSERTSDGTTLKIGKWVKDRLLLFDLGYYRYQLFSCIDRQGGYFISRLKENANPLILTELAGNQKLVGRRLQDVLGSLRRSCLDVQVEVDFKRRVYGGGGLALILDILRGIV